MSGGSYDYVFAKVDNECSGKMYDYEKRGNNESISN